MKQHEDQEHREDGGGEDRADQGDEEEEGEAEPVRSVEHGG